MSLSNKWWHGQHILFGMIGNDDGVIKVTCGCFSVVLAILVLLLAWVTVDGCYSSYAKERRVREMNERQEKKIAQREEARQKTLREFAVAESPLLWKSIQELRGEIKIQGEKIDLLRDAIEKLGKNPAADADYVAFCEEYCVMTNRLSDVERSLEDAYLSSVKYRVSRPAVSKAEFERRVSDEGVYKATRMQKKYDDLRNEK